MVDVAQRRPQIIGGQLTTLLYTTQLAAISQDPWFSRVQTPLCADYVALDLDPMPDVPFARVLDVARWIRDELQLLGATGVPKTSGADGMHIYIPMPPDTPYEAGLLLCQIVATVVVQKHTRYATIDRAVRKRGKRVYVDYLQNILGKTLATAYSARASDYAGVSAPLSWDEVDAGVRREDFTIQSMPARLRRVGDLWATLRNAKGANLSRVARYAEREGRRRAQRDKREAWPELARLRLAALLACSHTAGMLARRALRSGRRARELDGRCTGNGTQRKEFGIETLVECRRLSGEIGRACRGTAVAGHPA